MQKESQAVLLRIFMGETDSHEGKPFYTYLVEYLRKHHFAGATVLRGIEGYGHSSIIHSANVLDLSTDLPIVLEVIDTAEKIELLKQLINETHGKVSLLVTEEHVKIVRYGRE